MSKFVAKDKSGNVVEPGSTMTDSWANTAEFKYASRANTENKDGKVVVTMPQGCEAEDYARVWRLVVEEADRG